MCSATYACAACTYSEACALQQAAQKGASTHACTHAYTRMGVAVMTIHHMAYGMSATVCKGAVADARMGLACCSISAFDCVWYPACDDGAGTKLYATAHAWGALPVQPGDGEGASQWPHTLTAGPASSSTLPTSSAMHQAVARHTGLPSCSLCRAHRYQHVHV